MSVALAEALRGAPVHRTVGDGSVRIADVTHDSRAVPAASLFCCLRGATADGHAHAQAAVDAGAVALLVDHEVEVDPPVPQAVAADTRVAMAPIAAAVHGHPSAALGVVGVTGTNGKTTTTALLGAALTRLGVQSAVLGTLSGARTTPEAPDLQRWLAGQRDAGVAAVAMEVSSHALVQHRVDATRFAVAVFTNLTPDHLDYHGTMEAYFEAKALLFTPAFTGHAVVNVDDPWGRRLADRLAGGPVAVHPYGAGSVAHVVVGGARCSFEWRGAPVELPIGGRFNVANAVAAAEALVVLGHEPGAVAAALSGPVTVPGRFEPVDAGQPFAVVVDYAHTPDGLEQVLRSAGEVTGEGGLVRVVFGCGGDRDRAKRPLMGAAAARLADHVVLTADNSRSEPTAEIIAAIEAGVAAVDHPRAARIDVEPDRAAAIAVAVRAARPGDVVVLAGKGHETTQTIGAVVTEFDDREVARSALADLGGWGP